MMYLDIIQPQKQHHRWIIFQTIQKAFNIKIDNQSCKVLVFYGSYVWHNFLGTPRLIPERTSTISYRHDPLLKSERPLEIQLRNLGGKLLKFVSQPVELPRVGCKIQLTTHYTSLASFLSNYSAHRNPSKMTSLLINDDSW